MTDIRINKIHNLQPQQTEKKEKNEEKKEQEITNKPELKQKKASDVLDYMANTGMLNKTGIKSNKLDVTKHVDQTSADRIEKVMKAFEETILKSAEIAVEELGISESKAQDVAITAFNQKFLI